MVESYEEMLELRDVTPGYPLQVLCELCDLRRALPKLDRGEREVLLVVGIAGVSVRAAEPIMGSPRMTIHRRYVRALEKLTTYMNGAK